MQKRKLTIAAAAIALAFTAAQKAEGQYVKTYFNARPIISGPIIPGVPAIPMTISQPQLTLGNLTLTPTLSAIPSAPAPFVRAATLSEARLPSVAQVPVMIPITAPAATVQRIRAPAEAAAASDMRTAAPAVRQSALNKTFDGSSAERKASDLSDLVSEMGSYVKSQSKGMHGTRMLAMESGKPLKAQLNKGESVETDDFVIVFKEVRATTDGSGAAHFSIKNKHSGREADLFVMNDTEEQFSIVNLKDRWQRIYAIKVGGLTAFDGRISMEIVMVGQGEIYTAAKAQKERVQKTLEVGDEAEIGPIGVRIESISNGWVRFHAGYGESEWEFSVRVGESKDIHIEDEDCYGTYSFKVISIDAKDGKKTALVLIEEK